MKKPAFYDASIAAAGTTQAGVVRLIKTRTLSVTTRTTYNASATGALRVYLYYSPDGEHFDTVPYTYFDVTITAGATVQETKSVDMPEHGYIAFKLYNQDATYTTTENRLWYSIQKYPNSEVKQ